MPKGKIYLSVGAEWPETVKKVGKDLLKKKNWEVKYIGPNAKDITVKVVSAG